jgi:hypothetical protein
MLLPESMPNMHLRFIHAFAAAWCLSLAAYGDSRLDSFIKFDEFGAIPCAEERERIDNYGSALQEQTGGIGVVIVFAGHSDTRFGEVAARLFGIRDRLNSVRFIDRNRLIILDGGVRENLQVQLWILPAEARDAARMLAFDSQIASKDIRLKSPRVEKWEYKCRGAH